MKKSASQIASSSSSAGDVYYSLQFLNSFDAKSSCDCNNIKAVAKASTTAIDAYYALTSGDLCNCGLKSISKKFSDLALISSNEELESLAGKVLLGLKTGAVTKDNISDHLVKVLNLLKVDGSVQLIRGEHSSSLSNLHLVLQLLSAVKSAGLDIEPLGSEIVEKASSLIPGANSDNLNDPTIIALVNSLSDKKIRLTSNQQSVSSEALVGAKYSTNPQEILNAYNSLALINSYKSAPVYTGLISSIFELNEPVKLEVEVVDALGNAIETESVVLTSFKKLGKEGVIVADANMENGALDLSKENLQSGRYGATFSVTLKNKSTNVKFQAPVLVKEAAKVKNVVAGVSDSKQANKADLETLSSQNSLAATASAVSMEFFHASFNLDTATGRKPHQAALKFSHKSTGRTVLFASQKSGEESTFSFSVGFGDEIEKFNYLSGEYVVSILVGDIAFSNTEEWFIGSISVSFPSKPVVNLPLYAKSLLHSSDVTLEALPEIAHQMRPPAKRASDFMAGSFTLLTLLPLLAFVGFILSVKPNLNRLTSLSSIALVVVFASILVLYAGYWLSVKGMSFYSTIKYLCALYPVTIFIARFSLSAVMGQRLKEEGKKN